MADKQQQPTAEAPYARRIVDTWSSSQQGGSLSAEQLHFIRHVELERWKRKTPMLRGRNALTGLAIGAVVMGIYGYTFYSVSQEHLVDQLDEEVKMARMSGGAKTGDN